MPATIFEAISSSSVSGLVPGNGSAWASDWPTIKPQTTGRIRPREHFMKAAPEVAQRYWAEGEDKPCPGHNYNRRAARHKERHPKAGIHYRPERHRLPSAA